MVLVCLNYVCYCTIYAAIEYYCLAIVHVFIFIFFDNFFYIFSPLCVSKEGKFK